MSRNAGLREELLGTILATAPVGIVVVEPGALRVLLANEQYRRWLDPEWHDRDLTGRLLSEIVPGLPMEELRAECDAVMRTGETMHHAEFAHAGFVRGVTYWQLALYPVMAAHGVRVAVMMTTTEITAQVRARRETETTNAALASFAAISGTITASLDFDVVMDRLLTAVAPLIFYERAFIILDDGPETLRIAAARYQGGQKLDLLGLRFPKGRSVNGQVFRDARSVRIRDFLDDAEVKPGRYRPTQANPEARSALSVPLVARERVIGTFYLTSRQPDTFSEADLHRLERLAPQAAAAVANALLYREVTARAAELETANEVAALVSSSLDFDETMDRVLTAIAPLIPYERAVIILDDGPEHLRIAAARLQNAPDMGQVGTRIARGASVSGHVLRTGRAILVPDANDPAHLPPTGIYRSDPPDPNLGALLCAPLIARGAALGTLLVVRRATYSYSDADLHRLEQIVPQIASAVANALLYREATGRATELEAANGVATAVTASLDFDEVMNRVLTAVTPLVPFERALVLLDDGPEYLRVASVRQPHGEMPLPIGMRVPKAGSICGHVVRTGRALSVADVDDPALLPPGGVYRIDPPDPNLGAVLCVPLVARGAVIGTLFVERRLRYGYTDADLRRLEQIAPQVASAVGNALLYRTATEHARESEALSAVATTVAASLDLPEVLHRILEQIAELVGYDRAQVLMPDDDKATLRVVSWRGAGPSSNVGTTVPVMGSNSGRVFTEGRPVLIPDLMQAPEWLHGEYCRNNPPDNPRSVIFIPLRAGNETVGVLHLVREVANGYDDEDLRQLVRFAAPIALAVTNARHYAQSQERAVESETLSEVATTVAASLAEPDVLHRILDQIGLVVGYDQAQITIPERDGATLRIIGARGGDAEARVGATIPVAGSNTGRVFAGGRSVLIADVSQVPGWIAGGYRLSQPLVHAHAAMLVPLRAQGETVGVIHLLRMEADGYDEADLRRLERFAPPIALALANARLFAQAQERAVESQALSDVATAVAGSLSLPDVMHRVLDQLLAVVGYDQAQVTVPDDDDKYLHVVAGCGDRFGPTVGDAIPIVGSHVGSIYASNQPKVIASVTEEAGWLARGYFPDGVWLAPRASMIVPLRAQGRVVGTLQVIREVVGGYNEEDLRRLVRFAAPIALAITNARLHAQTQERAVEFQTLSEVATTVAASLTLPDVLERVLSEIAAAVGYDETLIALADAGDAELRIVSAKGTRFGPTVGTGLPIEGSVSGVVFRENRSLLLPDVDASAEWQPRMYYGTVQPAPNSRASMTVPLRAQGETLGVLVVVRNVADGYNESDLRRLERFAPAIALAIANARLYERVQAQVGELQRLNADLADANRAKSEFLATMSHELRTPLNAILGFTELLREDLVTDADERRLCFDDIYVSATHLLRLVNDVLDIAKIEAGMMKMRPEAFPLPDVIAEAERGIAPLVAQNRHTLTVLHADGLPLVYADRGRVRQIVLNLLSNANKFTPEGGSIRIVTDCAGAAARVRVIDTGIGIHPEDAGVVFEEFRQIDGSLARKYEGTGLGLALSKRFVEMQGGAITFESEPGVGTTFTLLLPLAAAVHAADDGR